MTKKMKTKVPAKAKVPRAKAPRSQKMPPKLVEMDGKMVSVPVRRIGQSKEGIRRAVNTICDLFNEASIPPSSTFAFANIIMGMLTAMRCGITIASLVEGLPDLLHQSIDVHMNQLERLSKDPRIQSERRAFAKAELATREQEHRELHDSMDMASSVLANARTPKGVM